MNQAQRDKKNAYNRAYSIKNKERLKENAKKYRSPEYEEELQESLRLEILNRDKLAQSVKNLEDFYYHD